MDRQEAGCLLSWAQPAHHYLPCDFTLVPVARHVELLVIDPQPLMPTGHRISLPPKLFGKFPFDLLRVILFQIMQSAG